MPPIAEGGLEQLERAGDVGGDEFAGAIDRTVDMRFGSEVHDRIRLDTSESLPHGLGVTDVGLDEGEAGLTFEVCERGAVTRVGELIDDRDVVTTRDQKVGQICPDEASAAGD